MEGDSSAEATDGDVFRDFRWAQYARVGRLVEGHEAWFRFGSAFGLAVLTGVLAQVSIITPLTPVPYTLQVLGISLMGGLLGRKWGSASALLYLLMGAIGFPVFAGQWAVYDGFELFGGVAVFTGALSAGYLLGYPLYAYVVGMVRDAQSKRPARALTWFGAVGVGILILFGFIDAYFLANYNEIYPGYEGSFPNPWFGVAVVGLAALVGAGAYLAWRSPSRRERVELFLGNLAGLVLIYITGAVWFGVMWQVLGNEALGLAGLLRFTVLPFIPADITKIVLAVAAVTALQPTQREIEERAEWNEDV